MERKKLFSSEIAAKLKQIQEARAPVLSLIIAPGQKASFRLVSNHSSLDNALHTFWEETVGNLVIDHLSVSVI